MDYYYMLVMASATISVILIRMLFIEEARLFAVGFIAFAIGVFTIYCLRDLYKCLKELKHKVFLEKLFYKMAKEYCKSKYNKDIEPVKVMVHCYRDFIANEYMNSCTIYFDEEEKLFLLIYLDSNFCVNMVADNLVQEETERLDERLRRVVNEASNNNLT